MTTVTTTGNSYDRTPSPGWRPLALAGGVIGLLGLLAIAFPLATGLSVTLGLGALLLVSAVVHGVHAFTVRDWSGSLWQVALAVVAALAGLLLLANPIVALASLTLVAIAYFLVDGATELWMAVRMADRPGRAAVAVSGLVSFVLAGLLWIGFPADATWAVGTLVGVGLLATGLSMAAVAIAGRNAGAEPAAVEPRTA